MAQGKPGRPRSDSLKLHLALPKDIGSWVEKQTEAQPFCRSRQDFYSWCTGTGNEEGELNRTNGTRPVTKGHKDSKTKNPNQVAA